MNNAILFSLLLAAAAPGRAAAVAPPAANRYAAAIAPAERFASGVLAVERHGAGGRGLILIPGLVSGAWAWQSVIADLATDYTVYVVTLPGFDGRPFAPGDGLAAARAGLRELVISRKLDRPVLIGHSLGGTLALAVAEDLPQTIGGVVAIDGLPVFPGTEAMAPAQRAAMAANAGAGMAAQDQATFARQQQAYMRSIGVRDMTQADQLAQLSSRSSAAAAGVYVSDLLGLDLRPGLASIAAPVLVLAPYFDQDPMDVRWTAQAKTTYYASLLAGAPRVEVLPVLDARHFLMFDQPQVLSKMLRAYLKAL